MSTRSNAATPRREFLQTAGRLTAASALAGVAVPHVHAAEDNTIRVALIGCGGRGTGAAANALSTKSGPIKLVAMADVFDARLKASHKALSKQFAAQMDVAEDRKFIGFDGYRKAMDCLKPGDVALLATPPAFRWVHFGYAIEKGLNVFMEKPVTVDGPTTRKLMKLGEASLQKNLKVSVGLMSRHSKARQALLQQIKDGAAGELILMRTYRMHGPIASFASGPKPAGIGELFYQIQRFHSFLWASGGCFSDFNIHSIDECCWMKGAWPVQAQATGGRHYRGDLIDQNFDSYSVEYTFADGTKLFMIGRCISGCANEFNNYLHGSKGLVTVTGSGQTPAKCRIYHGHNADSAKLAWNYADREPNPYQVEWDVLIDAIRHDKPHNEVQRGAEASLVTSMGRMAAHTGRIVTYDEILHHDHEFAPLVDRLTMTSPAPLLAGKDGKYPVPQPGIVTNREYA
jgi:predicted dehydrogenase